MPDDAGASEGGPNLEERVARLEQALSRFSHFVQAELRPDLGTSALRHEPGSFRQPYFVAKPPDKGFMKDDKEKEFQKDRKDRKEKDKEKDKDKEDQDKGVKDGRDWIQPDVPGGGGAAAGSLEDRIARLEAAIAQLTHFASAQPQPAGPADDPAHDPAPGDEP